MKKLIALLLALAMVFGMVACGQKEEPAPEAAPDATPEATSDVAPEAEPEVEELEEKTIQVMLPGPGTQADSEAVWAEFNKLLQDYVPNTTVEFTVVPFAEYKDEYTRVLAAGEEFDLTWVGYATNLQNHMEDGDLLPLDDLLATYAPETAELLTEKVLDMHRFTDGELYYLLSWQGLIGQKRAVMIPTVFVEYVETKVPNWQADTQAAITAWWNADGPVETVYEQFDKFFTAVADHPDYAWGFNIGSANGFLGYYDTGRSNLISHKNGVGVMHNDATFTVVDSYASDEYKTKCEWAAKWFAQGNVIPTDILSADTSIYAFPQNGEFTENDICYKNENYWVVSQEADYEAQAGMEITFMPIEDTATLTSGKATGMAIPYCADEPERGMMVLNALYTVPELYRLLAYGFEGTHYTLDEEGIMTHVGLASSDSPYGLDSWYFGTCLNSYPISADNKTFYQDLIAEEANAYVNPFINFTYNATETSDIIAALNAVNSEYENSLKSGAYGADWEAKYNEFIQKRKDAGVDKLIEDYQNQLNAYMQKNNITSW